MAKEASYESFPLGPVILCVIFSLFLYFLGAYILSGLWIGFALLYLLYCFGIELNVLYRSCRSCYYYGKRCGLGKGWMCDKLFKKGDPQHFLQKQITWMTMIPDFLVFIFPIAGGIILLILRFSWITLGLLIILAVLSFGGTATIRGKFACNYCKQRELGCPAQQLFQKKA